MSAHRCDGARVVSYLRLALAQVEAANPGLLHGEAREAFPYGLGGLPIVGKAGDRLQLTLEDTGGSSFFDPAVSVHRPDGSLLASASAALTVQVEFGAPATEALFIAVRNGAGFTGSGGPWSKPAHWERARS